MSETQTETTPVSNGNAKTSGTLKKVSATQINLSKEKAGFVLEGRLIGINKSDYVDDEGEQKVRHGMVIENKKGERLKFLADAGLRTALEDAMVVSGDWFKAVKGEKINLGGARTMNTWDIFQYV